MKRIALAAALLALAGTTAAQDLLVRNATVHTATARGTLKATDVLVRDGAQTPRMLCLHLHPWLSGEAFRARALRPVLARLAQRDDVWLATPEQMVVHLAGGI